jgi:hypothetical protein
VGTVAIITGNQITLTTALTVIPAAGDIIAVGGKANSIVTLNHAFSPAPLGRDLFAEFGEELAMPIVGNFDPPVIPTIVTIGPVLAGDYDQNGVIEQADLAVWKSSFGSTTNLAADGNGDGVVNSGDYVIWRKNLGSSGGGGSNAGASTSDSAPAFNDEPPAVASNADMTVIDANSQPANLVAASGAGSGSVSLTGSTSPVIDVMAPMVAPEGGSSSVATGSAAIKTEQSPLVGRFDLAVGRTTDAGRAARTNRRVLIEPAAADVVFADLRTLVVNRKAARLEFDSLRLSGKKIEWARSKGLEPDVVFQSISPDVRMRIGPLLRNR